MVSVLCCEVEQLRMKGSGSDLKLSLVDAENSAVNQRGGQHCIDGSILTSAEPQIKAYFIHDDLEQLFLKKLNHLPKCVAEASYSVY